MTIEKAIENLEKIERLPKIASWAELTDALQLGIEALKLLEHWRHENPNLRNFPLLGETED